MFAGVRKQQDGEALKEAAASGRLVPVIIDVTDADGIARARDAVPDMVGSGQGIHALPPLATPTRATPDHERWWLNSTKTIEVLDKA